MARCCGVGRARGIIGGFEPNGVENWESMEGGVGRVGEPGGIIGGFEPNGVENRERMEGNLENWVALC